MTIRKGVITLKINRGQIWWGSLGNGVGSEQSGYRPLLVVSNDRYNESSTVVTVVPLTSKIKTPMATHYTMKANQVSGTMLCEQIRCIAKERLTKYADTLPEEEMKEVEKALKAGLGI